MYVCFNKLVIKGHQKNLKQFIDYARGKNIWGQDVELTLNKFIPYPEEFREMDNEMEPYALCDDGYEWCEKYYNSPNDVWKVWLDDDLIENGQIEYDFLSEGYPPKECVKVMTEMFPSLDFELDDKAPIIPFSSSFYECWMTDDEEDD